MQIIPLVRAKYVFAYDAVLNRLGASSQSLLERVGLSGSVLENPEAIIPAHQAWRFIGLAAEKEGIDDFGLVAGDISIQTYGEFSRHLFQAANLNQALDAFCQLARCEYSRADFFVSRSEESTWFCRGPIDGNDVEKKHVELLVLTMMIATVRLVAGQDWQPPVIFLQTKDPRRVEEHKLFSRSTIRFGNLSTAFEVPQHFLTKSLPGATALPGDDSYDRLENELLLALSQVASTMLADGCPKIHSVAEAVGTSVRTLQRHLSEMNTTFSAIIEATRMRLATQLLTDRERDLHEISHQLKYTDQANFTRAFRRWAGMSPRAYRRQQLQVFDETE